MKTTYKNFAITGELVQKSSLPIWENENKPKKDSYHHSKYKITVENIHTDHEIAFPFYGSVSDWENGIFELSQNDLLHCFYWFINDAIAGLSSYEDFITEFGYTDKILGDNIYKACKSQYEKAKKLGFDKDNIYDFINEFSDYINQ